jgi:hypothetical protein
MEVENVQTHCPGRLLRPGLAALARWVSQNAGSGSIIRA